MKPATRLTCSWPRSALLALVSGLLMALGFAPWQFWPAPILGVALLTRLVSAQRLRRGFALGTAAGLSLNLATIWWVGSQAGPAWLALAAFMALWVGLAGMATAAITRLPGWLFLAPAVWGAIEFGAALGPFGGFPWLRLGHTVLDQPLAGWLPLLGTPGVTWLVAFVGCAIAAMTQREWLLSLLGAGAAFAVGGAWLLIPVPQGEDSVSVGMVQGNVELSEVGGYIAATGATPHHLSETIFLLAEARANHQLLDFIVWAENSTDRDPELNDTTRSQIETAVELAQVPIFVGALTLGPEPNTRQTTSQVWVPGRGVTQEYHKRNLAPFGEFVPMREFLEPLFPQVERVGAQSIAGTEPGVVTIPVAGDPGLQVGTMVCYELAYDQTVYDTVIHGAQVLVAQSTTHNFSGTSEPYQQMVITRARAAELRRPIVAVTLNGYSGLVDPYGVVEAPTREYTAAHRIFQIPKHSHTTPAVLIAALLGPIQLLLAAGGVALSLLRPGNLDRTSSSCKE